MVTGLKLRFSKKDYAELKVSKDIIKKLIPYLFKNYEYSGALNFSLDKITHLNKYIECKSIKNLKRGDNASVHVTKGTINFHTHPQACYKDEQTNWGWPSGDDMRECIRFMFDGTICHLIFTLEGIYTIQVNPCILKYLKNEMGQFGKSEDYARGIFISLIETYFKATHGHRCYIENLKLEQKGKPICKPEDWVKFANNFRFSNLQKGRGNSCSKALNCDGFPIENGRSMKLEDYLNNFQFEQWNYNKNGVAKMGKNDNHIDFIKKNFKKFEKLFDNACPSSYGNEKWERGQIFNVKFYSNCFKFHGSNGFKSYDTWFNWIKRQPGSLSENIYHFMQGLNADTVTFNDTPKITFAPMIDKNGKFGYITGKKLNDYLSK